MQWKHGGGILWKSGGGIAFDPSCCCSGCACGSVFPCPNCSPGPTPTQFHVTLSGITVCSGCITCPDLGTFSIQFVNTTINGTYLITQNGDCAWTAFSAAGGGPIVTTANLYFSGDCTGTPQPFDFALNLVRISSTQFAFQVTDDSNTLLIFDQVLSVPTCCQSFTMTNNAACGCYTLLNSGGVEGVGLGSGGTASFTPC
jgi:hypothetical protein